MRARFSSSVSPVDHTHRRNRARTDHRVLEGLRSRGQRSPHVGRDDGTKGETGRVYAHEVAPRLSPMVLKRQPVHKALEID